SSEVYLNVREEKQGKYLKAQTLEGLFDGIPQMHVFSWFDKLFVSQREVGFGILGEKRRRKPAFEAFVELKQALNSIDTHNLIKELHDDVPPVAFLLPSDKARTLHWNSWVNENWIVASYFLGLNIP